MSITTMPGNVKLLCEVDQCYVHRFIQRQRILVSQGPCQIFQSQTSQETPEQQKIWYLRVNNFFQVVRKQQTYIRIRYTGAVCYLFQSSEFNSIQCISFGSNAGGLQNFEIQMGKNFHIIDFSSELLDEKLKQKIRTNCPQNLQKQDISYQAKKTIKKIGLNIGMYARKASKIVQGPAKQAVHSLSDRANRFSDQNISQNAKSKWNSIKQTSSTINDAMTTVVSPVMRLIDNVSTQIGKSFQSSQNVAIKTIRQYSQAFCNSLNEGQQKGKQIKKQIKKKTLANSNQFLKEQISAISLR